MGVPVGSPPDRRLLFDKHPDGFGVKERDVSMALLTQI
jgi:hypothetical protein